MSTADRNTILDIEEKEKLGRSTWHLLHTIAKYYPNNPTRQQKKAVHDLITSLSVLYPCGSCASTISLFKNSSLLNATNRGSLVFSFCEFHNWVNIKLNKPVVNCHRIYHSSVNHNFNQISRAASAIISCVHKLKNIIIG